jgi:hypothetical protein
MTAPPIQAGPRPLTLPPPQPGMTPIYQPALERIQGKLSAAKMARCVSTYIGLCRLASANADSDFQVTLPEIALQGLVTKGVAMAALEQLEEFGLITFELRQTPRARALDVVRVILLEVVRE